MYTLQRACVSSSFTLEAIQNKKAVKTREEQKKKKTIVDNSVHDVMTWHKRTTQLRTQPLTTKIKTKRNAFCKKKKAEWRQRNTTQRTYNILWFVREHM